MIVRHLYLASFGHTGRYGRSGEEPSRQVEGEDDSYSDEERAAIFMKGMLKGGMVF